MGSESSVGWGGKWGSESKAAESSSRAACACRDSCAQHRACVSSCSRNGEARECGPP